MPAQALRDARAEAVRLHQHGDQLLHILHAGAVRQVVERLGATLSGAQFQVHHREFVTNLRVRRMQFLGNLNRRLVDPQA